MSHLSVYAAGTACIGFMVAQLTYSQMLARARRKNDLRVMSLHHMIHHDKEFNVLGLWIPPKWFGGGVVLDIHRQYIVAPKTFASDFTVVATGAPCMHCGFMAKENVTEIVFSSLPNTSGLDFPSARRQTFLLCNAWMDNDVLKTAQQNHLRKEAAQRERIAEAGGPGEQQQ